MRSTALARSLELLVLTPSQHRRAEGTGRPDTCCVENMAPVKPAASGNAVATASASPGERRSPHALLIDSAELIRK